MKYFLLILFIFSSSTFAKSNAELLVERLDLKNEWMKLTSEITEYALAPETSNDMELLTITLEHNEKLKLIIRETLEWSDYEPIILKMINEVFTDDELAQIIAFYQSEAGKKLLDEENLVYKKFQEEITNSISHFDQLYTEERDRYSKLLDEIIKERK